MMSHTARTHPALRSPGGARAFSLIELLVVVAIIAIVIAIVLPAIGGARSSARAATTNQLMTGVTNAAQLFAQDNQRLPGYFGSVAMGADENEAAGFSAMQNAMLELSGGLVFGAGLGEDANENRFLAGPYPASDPRNALVDFDLIGAEQEGVNVYFTADPKNFKPQTTSGQQAAANAANRRLPSVIDSFGSPLLLWSQDGAGRSPRDWTEVSDDTFAFARVSSGGTSGTPRRGFFYWNSNAAFLRATAAGAVAANQNIESLLGGSVDEEDRQRTMAAVLGHPGFPKGDLSQVTSAEAADLIASAPRGSFIVQSAGRDGIYLGEADGNDVIESGENYVRYAANFYTAGGTERYTNASGDPITEDVMSRFDDMMTSSGE